MGSLKNLSVKPTREMKPWAVWIWNLSINKQELETQLRSIAEKEFGGVAIRPGRDMNPPYMSHEFKALFGRALELARELGLSVRIADDFSMPWCTVFSSASEQNTELRLHRLVLDSSTVVPAKEQFEGDIADPATAMVLAVKLVGSAVDLDSTKVIPLSAGHSHLSWKAPTADEWRIMVLRKEFARDPSGAYLPNVYSPKLSDTYIKTVLEPLRGAFSKFVPSTFEGFVNEMPALFPSDNGIPWDDILVIRYRSRYKKDLIKLLPSVFFDACSGQARNRSHVLTFIHETMYDNFADPLERWGKKLRFSQWLLCAEQDAFPGRASLNYFNALPQGTYAHVGLQNYDGLHKGYSLLRAAADMNAMETKRTTLAVVGRNRACMAGSVQSLKNEIDQFLSMGPCTLVIDGLFFNLDHRTHIKTPFNPFWYSPDWEFMPHLCSYAARLREVTEGLHPACDVAVLMPSLSVQSEYTPRDNEVTARALGRMEKVVDELRRLNISFDIVSEDMLVSCPVRPTGHFGSTEKARANPYRVLILPYARLVSKSLFVFLEKVEMKKGTIVFVDDAPQGNLDQGASSSFSERVEALLKSRHGTVAVLSAAELSRVREGAEPSARVTAQGKDCPDVILTQGHAETYSMFHVWNQSDTVEWHVLVDLPQFRHFYSVDCASGALHELTNVEPIEKYSQCPLAFQPWESYVLVATNTKLSLPAVEKDKKHPTRARVKMPRNYRVVLRNQWRLSGRSLNVLPLSSWSTRIGLSREFGGYSHYCETYFEVKEIPPTSFLLLNEFSGQVGQSAGLDKSFELTINGNRAGHFHRGTIPNAPDGTEPPHKVALKNLGYARDSLVCDLRELLTKGYNRIALRSVGLVGDPPVILYPPLVVGDFSVERGTRGWTVGTTMPTLSSDSWTSHGFPYLSGAGTYTQVFEIPSAFERLMLNFSKVSGPLNVKINGVDLGWIDWQPMEIDVSKACTAKRNELVITVLNTVDNVLRLNGRPSGLLGEVFLDVY